MATRDTGEATARQEKVAQMRVARRRAERMRRMGWTGAVTSLLAVVATAVWVAVLHGDGQAASAAAGQSVAAGRGQLGPEGIPRETGPQLASIRGAAGGDTVDGIQCDASESVAYHIHTHLAVYVTGAQRSIPYGVGVVAPLVTQTAQGPFVEATRCYYWLHTHAADGVIHVESPTQAQYTLGDFFDIWGQPLSGRQVGPVLGPVTAYVNGRVYKGDPRTIVLGEREDVQLDIARPAVPPQPVDWSTSQL